MIQVSIIRPANSTTLFHHSTHCATASSHFKHPKTIMKAGKNVKVPEDLFSLKSKEPLRKEQK